MNPYDYQTRDRLVRCHGPDRAAAIIAGEDRATNVDLARWHAIGGEVLLPHAERLARAVSMVEAGVDAQTAAMHNRCLSAFPAQFLRDTTGAMIRNR